MAITIDRAIEILSDKVTYEYSACQSEEGDAVKLSIQGLQAIKCGREGLRTEFFTPLMGETKE